MSHQIEVGRAIGGDSGPSTDVEIKTAAHRSWFILAMVLIVAATLLVWGIWSRIEAGIRPDAFTMKSPFRVRTPPNRTL